MKYLRQFEYFDWNGFAKHKRFMTVGISPLTDRETKEIIGTRVEIVTTQDNTPYERKENEKGSNLFEKLYVKVPKQIDVPMQVEVQLKNAVATVYGDYRNQLSVYAEDIVVVEK
ncbi:hypothetical protein [Mediterraneibacter sp.]|jgi:hypothetical protein|uniref:hypothetical protein n=1 Tax=Mediterraneibacter sp. TaxID=2316022 RepID=UPI00204C70D6|nr:hypothetical protein [Mediterraneibacter sp.]DAZ05171.1 MAG TPA: hypothetical protein [Caudoviricetes sp.]